MASFSQGRSSHLSGHLYQQNLNNTRLYPLTIIFLFVSMSLAGCRAAHSPGREADLQEVADRVLGRGNQVVYNASKTYALCQQKPGSDHARRRYRYVVIRLHDLAIMREGQYSMGYARWFDNDSIEVVSGSPSVNKGSTKTIIDVNSPQE